LVFSSGGASLLILTHADIWVEYPFVFSPFEDFLDSWLMNCFFLIPESFWDVIVVVPVLSLLFYFLKFKNCFLKKFLFAISWLYSGIHLFFSLLVTPVHLVAFLIIGVLLETILFEWTIFHFLDM
jgi:hypothetical protein